MLPRQSVESQVIDYLDTIDKSELMIKYNFDLILDYYIPKKKKSKDEEIAEFIDFLSNYVPIDRPIEAVISEAEDILFGKGKSNKTKAIEVLKMLTISYKASKGTMVMMSNMLNELKLLD
jgi:preprotein translocase subunit SecA